MIREGMEKAGAREGEVEDRRVRTAKTFLYKKPREKQPSTRQPKI